MQRIVAKDKEGQVIWRSPRAYKEAFARWFRDRIANYRPDLVVELEED